MAPRPGDWTAGQGPAARLRRCNNYSCTGEGAAATDEFGPSSCGRAVISRMILRRRSQRQRGVSNNAPYGSSLSEATSKSFHRFSDGTSTCTSAIIVATIAVLRFQSSPSVTGMSISRTAAQPGDGLLPHARFSAPGALGLPARRARQAWRLRARRHGQGQATPCGVADCSPGFDLCALQGRASPRYSITSVVKDATAVDARMLAHRTRDVSQPAGFLWAFALGQHVGPALRHGYDQALIAQHRHRAPGRVPGYPNSSCKSFSLGRGSSGDATIRYGEARFRPSRYQPSKGVDSWPSPQLGHEG